MKPELFNDYYQDTCGITKQNMIVFLQESSMYFMKKSLESVWQKSICLSGERENNVSCFLQESCMKPWKKSSLNVLPAMYHGEFSINHADLYVKELCAIVKQH